VQRYIDSIAAASKNKKHKPTRPSTSADPARALSLARSDTAAAALNGTAPLASSSDADHRAVSEERPLPAAGAAKALVPGPSPLRVTPCVHCASFSKLPTSIGRHVIPCIVGIHDGAASADTLKFVPQANAFAGEAAADVGALTAPASGPDMKQHLPAHVQSDLAPAPFTASVHHSLSGPFAAGEGV
jgi:hypothetical protein